MHGGKWFKSPVTKSVKYKWRIHIRLVSHSKMESNKNVNLKTDRSNDRN